MNRKGDAVYNNCQIKYNLKYTWEDTIDPNSDEGDNVLVFILDPFDEQGDYDVFISWDASVQIDIHDSKVTHAEGCPFEYFYDKAWSTMVYVKNAIFYHWLLLIMIMCGCTHKSEYIIMNGDGLIQHPGTYLIENIGYTLTIIITKEKTVDYCMMDSQGNEIIRPKYIFSNFHKWAMFWESDKKKLWITSSDMSEAVWVNNEDGIYVRYIISRTPELIRDMPTELYEKVPSSRRHRKYDKYRLSDVSHN